MPKAPPKFVTNIGAWEYTLAKLGNDPAKNYLTDNGDPRNYGQAVAIYKRVVAKYPAFRSNNIHAIPMRAEGDRWQKSHTIVDLMDRFPVGSLFWYDDVLCEAVDHMGGEAIYPDSEGKLFIRGKVCDVDPDGAHKNWPIGKVNGFPPHRCSDLMEVVA